MKATTEKGNKMRGGIRRRGAHGAWSYMVDLGPQAAVRCNACNARQWLGHERPTACAKCGGELRDTQERRQLVKGGFATREQAAKARDRARVAVVENDFVAPDKVTVADYLREWLSGLRSEDLKETTIVSYERAVYHHLIGPADAPHAIGRVQLQRLTREQVRTHFARLAEGGRMDGRGGLGPASLGVVFATLTKALGSALESGRVRSNVAVGATKRMAAMRRPAAQGPKAWSVGELAIFLESVRQDRLYALWRLLAMTGMRRGEALALRWEDVDLGAGTVSITKQRVRVGRRVLEYAPKSAKSVRTVAIDEETVAVLRRHAARQTEGLEQRYIFTSPTGEPLSPAAVSSAFADLVAAALLPTLSIHGLRHTHATLALLEGMPLHVVSARLGHSSPTITLGVYAHSLPQDDADVAAQFAAKLGSACRTS